MFGIGKGWGKDTSLTTELEMRKWVGVGLFDSRCFTTFI